MFETLEDYVIGMTITERQQTDAVARQVSVKAIRQRRQKIAVEIAIILVLAAAVWVTEDRLSLFDQITEIRVHLRRAAG